MHRPVNDFVVAAARPQPVKRRGFPQAYDSLIKDIERMSAREKDLNKLEQPLRESFTRFLKECGYQLAVKNFEALQKEKSGDKFFRNDGTVGWYHEFIPIMMVLSAVRRGSRGNGVDLKEFQPYGGLEVMICGHLRHDSVEDYASEQDVRAQQYNMLDQLCDEGFKEYSSRGPLMVEQIMIDINLMTQNKLTGRDGAIVVDARGKPVKEDVMEYMHRHVVSPYANPVVFLRKQGDVDHNFATMLGAEKFEPERRAKRCNERENQYGARFGFTDIAIEKWKPFSKAIQVFDAIMGELLYKNFRYLENVDQFYLKSEDAFRRNAYDFPVSSRFLRKALALNLPEIIHPLHIFLKRMANSVDPETDPIKHQRLVSFMDHVIKPSLERRKECFPYLFNPPYADPAPKPVALG